jgi:hypothetical protein
MKYTQLIRFDDDAYTCRVADTLTEAKTLIENGFEFVTDMDDQKLFRKPK